MHVFITHCQLWSITDYGECYNLRRTSSIDFSGDLSRWTSKWRLQLNFRSLYINWTTISMRTKRSFEDGFRQRCIDLKETTIIVIYSMHQTLVLMGFSYDESQV